MSIESKVVDPTVDPKTGLWNGKCGGCLKVKVVIKFSKTDTGCCNCLKCWNCCDCNTLETCPECGGKTKRGDSELCPECGLCVNNCCFLCDEHDFCEHNCACNDIDEGDEGEQVEPDGGSL